MRNGKGDTVAALQQTLRAPQRGCPPFVAANHNPPSSLLPCSSTQAFIHPSIYVRDINREAFEEGGEQDKGHAWGVLQVGNDGAAEAICPQVAMHVVLC